MCSFPAFAGPWVIFTSILVLFALTIRNIKFTGCQSLRAKLSCNTYYNISTWMLNYLSFHTNMGLCSKFRNVNINRLPGRFGGGKVCKNLCVIYTERRNL